MLLSRIRQCHSLTWSLFPSNGKIIALESLRLSPIRTRISGRLFVLGSVAVSDSKHESGPYNVAIVGSGAIAFATSALLAESGHHPMLWSPSGSGTLALAKTKHLSVERNPTSSDAPGCRQCAISPGIAASARELVEQNDVILIALPANGHKRVFDAIAPYVRSGQSIIISSHSSLGALYLSRVIRERLGEKCGSVPIIAWGTTVCTARRTSETSVRVNTVRKSVDLCTIPQAASEAGLRLCQELFPQIGTFRPRDGLLAITLSNLNPQNHLGIALGNISRMEKGEEWYQFENITPAIGKLLESLDQERLSIAEAMNLETKTIFDHFSLSFHVPAAASIADMSQEIHKTGNDVYGPKFADSRYITEDVPFGLVPTIVLGKLANRPAVLHQSGVQLVAAMYCRDFVAENDLLPAMQLERYSLQEIQEAALTGVLPLAGVVTREMCSDIDVGGSSAS